MPSRKHSVKKTKRNVSKMTDKLFPPLYGYLLFGVLLAGVTVYCYQTGVIDLFPRILAYLSVAAGAFLCGFLARRLNGGKGAVTGLLFGVPYAAAVIMTLAVLSGSAGVVLLAVIPISIGFAALGGFCAEKR